MSGSCKNFVPIFRAPQDRGNLVTNKYSTHPAVTNLSRNSDELLFIAIGATPVQEAGKPAHKRTVAMRTLAEVWADDGDYTLDAIAGDVVADGRQRTPCPPRRPQMWTVPA